MNRFKHRDTLRIQIAGGGDAHAALNHRTQVGDNIAEHITRHDDIKPLRVFHHPHRRGIDESVFLLNIGEIRADFVKDALPEIVRERQYVRLIAKRQRVFLVAFPGELKRIADATFHAFVGVNHLLNSDFIAGAALEESADTGV